MNFKPEQKPNNEPKLMTCRSAPLMPNPNVIGGFVVVPQDREFKFKKLCPIVGATWPIPPLTDGKKAKAVYMDG